MTDEELKEAIAAEERRLEIQRLERELQMEELDQDSDLLNFGRTAAQGLTFGFGDEITAGIGSLFSDQSYDDLVANERAQLAAYAEDHPLVAFGAEALGGVFTGGAGLTRSLGAAGLKSLARGATARQAAGRGGVEGALYGLGSGEGDFGDRLENAAIEGGIGAVMGGGLTKLADVASSRRVAQDLVNPETGEFMPIQLAESKDSGLGSFYRDVLGRGWFAGKKLKEQQAPFFQREVNEIEGIDDELNALKRNADDFASVKRDAVGSRREEIDSINAQARDAADQVRRDADLAAQEAELQGIDELAGIAQRQDSTVAGINQQFRREAAIEALPPHARGLLDDVDLDDPFAVQGVIQDFYTKAGFQDARNRSFKFDDGDLAKSIKAAVRSDPNLALQFEGVLEPQLQKMQRRLQGDAPTPGTDLVPEDYIDEMLAGEFLIDGEALWAMRNVFKGTDWGKRRIKDVFDDFIIRNLDEDAARRFKQDKDHYAAYLAHTGALKKTIDQGDYLFTPSQYLKSARDSRTASYAEAPLEQVANKAIVAAKRAEDLGKKTKESRRRAQKQRKRSANSDANDQIKGLQGEARQKIERLRTANRRDLRDARKAKEDARDRRAASNARGGDRREAIDRLRELKRRGVGDTNLAGALNVDRYLGETLPYPGEGAGPRLYAAAVGGTLAAPLASEGMQKLIAGQTGA